MNALNLSLYTGGKRHDCWREDERDHGCKSSPCQVNLYLVEAPLLCCCNFLSLLLLLFLFLSSLFPHSNFFSCWDFSLLFLLLSLYSFCVLIPFLILMIPFLVLICILLLMRILVPLRILDLIRILILIRILVLFRILFRIFIFVLIISLL